ncbi:unnamed protein product, partial [Ectocarpus sp. 12 AP-2014]
GSCWTASSCSSSLTPCGGKIVRFEYDRQFIIQPAGGAFQTHRSEQHSYPNSPGIMGSDTVSVPLSPRTN